MFGLNVEKDTARRIASGRASRVTLPARDENPPRFKDGEAYPVCVARPAEPIPNSRRKRFVPPDVWCHVTIHRKEPGRAGDISFDEARAEGFRTSDEWKAWWVLRHDRAWLRAAEVEAGEVLEDRALVARFFEAHVTARVWVVRFELNLDPPRLLARGAGDDGHGYTTVGGIPGEAEAVDAWTQDAITRQADERFRSERRGEMQRRDARAAGAKLRGLEREAEARGVDLSGEMQEIRRVLERAERKVRESAEEVKTDAA